MQTRMKNQVQNTTNTYMIFIKDCALTFNNTTKTFVISLGQESSEIFGECTTKQVLDDIHKNTSDPPSKLLIFQLYIPPYRMTN